ncbi:MAG: hypothetical protein JNN09_01775 [Alphaproteobacteria bacterium]|nr:hypothetical protein [Alphaproteobacteria bacterium]
MTISQYNPRSRYRDRAAKRFHAFLIFLIVGGGCLSVGFWMGRQHSVIRIDTLQKEAEDARRQVTLLQEDLTKVRAEAQTAASRLDQLQSQYQKDLPENGPMRDLVEILRKQLEDGMSPDRLSFVIRSARPPRNCSDPASKRFMIRTPAYSGPDSTAAVGEGAVLISGIGASSRNKEGQPEAWYDPSQPITVTFKAAGAETERKMGTLPFQHSLIAGGREFRFTLSEGERSFVKVTYDSCDYP